MENTQLKSVLLIGILGEYSFGHFVIRELIKQRSSFRRIGVYHDTSRGTDERKKALLEQYREAGIEIIAGEGFASPTPYIGFDCVMVFLGNYGLHLQPVLIDAAIEAGVRHIYPSEYGADLDIGQNQTQRYYIHKIMTREHLKKRGQEIPELGWTYFLLGRLTEWAVTPHFGFNNRDATAKIYGTAEGRQNLINATDSATYIVETLKEPISATAEGHRRTYRISESSPTYAEIFDILQRVTGRRYSVEYLDVESAQEEERAANASGDTEAELAASHKLIQGREGTLLPVPWNNERFPGVKPAGLEDSLRAAFAHPKLRKAYGLD
ncbi:hypothetical protein BDV96DRAFT_610025 [Lophiotrema nucula]|uniref:NmrA-like domain-containing protein n=1 Tax=Lophiotrema nucula TaxID=690887 RepID=A0A6A5ZMZ0_9PLEO|nr:hypothetical protein BDV96DRAFT_610025 [Lophiotrema nucula]